MKKITKISIIFFLLVFFVGNITTKSCYAEENTISVVEMEENTVNENIKINIKYPQFKNDKNNGGLKKLNSKIQKEIETWKNDMMDLNKKYIEQGKKQQYPLREFEMLSTYKTTFMNENFISVVIDKYQYTGGAHGISAKSVYNYDIKKGRNIKLKELFKDNFDFQHIINNKIKIDIEKEKEIYFDEGKQFKGIKDNQSYYLTKEGIVIHFGLYEIAPYSSGYREFLIPYDLIKDGLIYKLQI